MESNILCKIPLFSSLPLDELDKLQATLRTRQFPPGAVLFDEGVIDHYCLILESGKVEIIKSLGTSDERILAVREPGTILGEMSLFTTNKAHTASVRSLTPLTLLVMTREEFNGLLHRQPGLAYEIARLMSRRLEESENMTIQDLRAKNLQLTQAYEELKEAHAQIVEKELLEKELQIARTIQESILPQVIPQFENLRCGALMAPARAVGGDFYDFIQLGDDLLGVVVGDVSDKGVPSALFMALTYSLVRAEASHTVAPGQTLRCVNRHLLDINVSNMFVTLLYGVVELRTGMFRYARAGQLLPFLVAANGNQLPVPSRLGQALGLFDEPALDEQEFQLPPGGTLLLFSDGLTDTANQQGEYFGLEQLNAFLARRLRAAPQEFCADLWRSLQAYSQGLPQVDDFTIVAMQWKQVDS